MLKTAQPSRLTATSPEARLAAKGFVWPDAWAQSLKLKVDQKQFTTNGREYMVDVIRDRSQEIVIKKAAQMGFTVGAILKALHAVVERHWATLYLLPNKNGAISFVQGRIDPIMDSNKELLAKFNRVENRTHKQSSDKVNFYIRGTNVLTELREIPVDFEIWDERDKFNEDNLTEALARMDGSVVGKLMQLSTPTLPGHGVDAEENWRASDQKIWFIPCPYCGRFQNINFEENIRLGEDASDSIIECAYCHKKIKDEDRWAANAFGRWEPQNLNGTKSGYHISQFNSSTKKFSKIIDKWFLGQTNVSILRGFHNNQLGEPYVGSDDQFTAEVLDECIVPGHRLHTIPNGPVYGGVDVGSVLHGKFSYLARDGKKVMYEAKIFKSFDELETFVRSLHNFNIVIDAHPDKHKASEFARQYPGRVWLGFERDSPNQSEIAVFHKPKKGEVGTVVIDRTMGLDQLIQDYQNGNYVLPANARMLGEDLPLRDYNGFYAHHLEMAREEVEDTNGRVVARWKKTRNPDHWHHADLFESIAFMKKPKLFISQEVQAAIGTSSFYE